jgi:serine/threonine-protein kinase
MEQKIVLERNVQFQEGTAPSDPHETQQLEEGLSFLKFRSKVITITPVMKEILEQLQTPHTVDEVVAWVSNQKECSYSAVYSSVYSFLNQMVKLGAVVREHEQPEDTTTIFSDWQTNNKFKGYTLVELIGKKSDVFLFKCVDESHPEVFYTIKILVRKKSKTTFFREVDVLNSLPPHPSIRKCFNASAADDEFPHLLLEYVEGKPISNADIKEKMPLPLKLKVAYEILQTLKHLHGHGILHGDIHASNFLVDESGNIKLIDLGMSHRVGDEQVGHGGIAKYMPPERMPDHRLNFSNQQGNYQSEIFQIGVCIYLLLSGHLPFGGLLLRDLANEIKHTDPDPLMTTPLGEAIPMPIAEIVFKALEKEPEYRYQSVAEMSSAWKRVASIYNDERNELLQFTK